MSNTVCKKYVFQNAVAWRCFTFSKEPVNPSLKSAVPSYNISQLAAPSVISHVMNASCDIQVSSLRVEYCYTFV